jgi:hypothetical protein
MGGYGSDKRYESSALVNYFKNKRKISLLASSNNINSTGFSMDEIFDNMGGGRNVSYFFNNEDNSYGIGNLRFGGGKGIIQSNMVGINYADEWFKGFDGNGAYFYSGTTANNTNRTRLVNLLPGGTSTVSNGSTVRIAMGTTSTSILTTRSILRPPSICRPSSRLQKQVMWAIRFNPLMATTAHCSMTIACKPLMRFKIAISTTRSISIRHSNAKDGL